MDTDEIFNMVNKAHQGIEANKNRLINQERSIESNAKSILKNQNDLQESFDSFKQSLFKFHVETKTGIRQQKERSV
jgi:hypothetical protein